MLHEEVSPEVAYKYFSKKIFGEFPEVEEPIKKALMIPGSTPERVAKIFMERINADHDDFEGKEFTIKALKHMQFLAQVEAGVYDG